MKKNIIRTLQISICRLKLTLLQIFNNPFLSNGNSLYYRDFVDFREEPYQDQELWYLVEVSKPNWLPQHVQGVPWHHFKWGCGADVQWDGISTQSQVSLHPNYQDCHHPRKALQEGEHEAVPQLQNQVPVGVQEG
jgi:hypothetical protein